MEATLVADLDPFQHARVADGEHHGHRAQVKERSRRSWSNLAKGHPFGEPGRGVACRMLAALRPLAGW
jgi:hypothetical protein